VNYRSLNDLFAISQNRADTTTYDVKVQMIEIYNEQVRDLLMVDGANKRLEIRNSSHVNGLNIPDANLVPVKCAQDVLDLMRVGHRNRAVGSTALNERSSRSHSVLTVHVQGKEIASGSTLRGCLHLVDLAGSERVDKSEAAGERLNEAKHINKSLSALGDVIAALAQKSSHVPYRNSKLTQVLQDALGIQNLLRAWMCFIKNAS
jgi:kinesin family protein C2/C3